MDEMATALFFEYSFYTDKTTALRADRGKLIRLILGWPSTSQVEYSIGVYRHWK